MHNSQQHKLSESPQSNTRSAGKKGMSLTDNRGLENPVQRKANNTGLPDNLKSGIENLSGHSMDDVKVHYNSSAPAQLSAHAYAQGTNIHIAPGQEKHLPHEAWHVVQQKQGRVKPTMQLKGQHVNDNSSLEKEADVMGEKAAQLKEIASDHSVQNSSPGNVVQRAWIPEGQGHKWDQLVDGVEWISNAEGQMAYRIVNEGKIKLGSPASYGQLAGQFHPRDFWVAHSVAGFDILGGLSSDGSGAINVDGLERFPSHSQFKTIYKYHGRLLSVPNDGNTSAALNEVAMLYKIAAKGMITANPEIVEIVQRGVKSMGILMDEVKGTFVNIGKDFSSPGTAYILHQAAAGKAVETSEAGFLRMMTQMKTSKPSAAPPAVFDTLMKSLTKILESSRELVINDLQIIMQPDGQAVIIDPQWAGHPSLITRAEEGLIRQTYENLYRMTRDLALMQAKGSIGPAKDGPGKGGGTGGGGGSAAAAAAAKK